VTEIVAVVRNLPKQFYLNQIVTYSLSVL